MTSLHLSKELLKTLLPENPVFIEAGAHKGRDTVKLAKLFPNSTIHAFEPVPHLFDQLQRATAGYAHIICYPYALGSTTGTALFHTSSGSSDAASSLLEPQLYCSERPGVLFAPPQIVQTITLDDWALREDITTLDCMWLDMQGFECAALQAGITILKKVSLIYTEVNYSQRYTGHPLFNEYKKWLETQGFRLIAEEKKKETWGNALFQRI